jgi:hypothetical protein
MHHVALDRAGPHDGDLDDQVVIIAGLEPGQHAHLGAGLDLEHPHRVGRAEHVVHLRVLHGHGGKTQRRQVRPPRIRIDQRDGLADGGEHPERQHIHLEQAQGLQVVLLPLDHGTVLHRGIFHRHQFAQRALADDEAPHVLGQMTGKAHQGAHQCHQLFQPPRRQRQGLHLGPGDDLLPVPVHRLRQHLHRLCANAQCPRHIADGTARPVADHRGSQRGTLAPVLAVDVLDDFLAPLVFEIHVDVRRLVPLLRQEALEQQLHARRVHRRDAQAVADHRIAAAEPRPWHRMPWLRANTTMSDAP